VGKDVQTNELTKRPLFSQDNVKKKVDEEGAFWIPREDLFSSNLVVLWHQVQSVAYVLICDEDENRALGINFLQNFPKELSEYYKANNQTDQGMEFFSRPEEVLILLQSFLPNGQLLFITPNFAKHLKKEAESTLAK